MHEKDCLVFILNLPIDHFAGYPVILKWWETASNHPYSPLPLFILKKRLLCKDLTEAKKKKIRTSPLLVHGLPCIWPSLFSVSLALQFEMESPEAHIVFKMPQQYRFIQLPNCLPFWLLLNIGLPFKKDYSQWLQYLSSGLNPNIVQI